ncbi:MAG TPA: DUF1697 domain-containing protein [Anaerolineaceae bacterium]|nr:DUF1697 domain-containing protein [Anaerolineaceae bacterium]
MGNTYIVFFRGINVGGKNKIIMTELKNCLEELGFSNVTTYIASGNVILDSVKKAEEIKTLIEKVISEIFILDDEFIKVLVISREQFLAVIKNKPEGFGEQPQTYHSDAIFLMEKTTDQVMSVFNPREGVDKIWPGNGVVYSQRLSAQRTKSRLNQAIGTPEYKFMTIRSWNTVLKLMVLLDQRK